LSPRSKEPRQETLSDLASKMRRSTVRRSKGADQAELTESFGKARAALESAARDIASLRERVTGSRRRPD
jgi:hypothetical protein